MTIDFVVCLQRTPQGYNAVWVIIDRLTKLAYFLTILMKFSFLGLAKLYADEIVKLYGVPVSVVSDHDPKFISLF